LRQYRNNRIGIIGCGAIAEIGHLPASMLVPSCETRVLVDLNLDRAQELAVRWNVPIVGTDYRALTSEFDLAIVATPPTTHAEVAAYFLSRGIPVLCEKPLATKVTDCHTIIEAAQKGKAVLVVGHMRRLFPNRRMLKSIIDQGLLGRIKRVELDEGSPFKWQSESGYMFLPAGGTGVLLDTGSHGLDTLLWLFGSVSSLDYRDDALGGVESNVVIDMQFANGVTGRVALSRTRAASNTLSVYGESGQVSLRIYDQRQLVLCQQPNAKARRMEITLACAPNNYSFLQAFADQLNSVVDSIRGNHEPFASGYDGLEVVKLVERCYNQRLQRTPPSQLPLPGVVQ
jgi:predicted dehydrogenase